LFVVEESLLDADDQCNLAYEDVDPARWDLHVVEPRQMQSEVVEDDERADEPIDPDPVVPTVGAN
jgi:hypothetical protein